MVNRLKILVFGAEWRAISDTRFVGATGLAQVRVPLITLCRELPLGRWREVGR
jgi:hypothetical protein